MKHFYIRIILFLFILMILTSFLFAQNITVNITSPANNAAFDIGSNITVTVSVVVDNDTLNFLQLFQNGFYVGAISKSTLTYTWKNVPSGYYSLTAVAFNKRNKSYTSDTVRINVGNTETNNKIVNGEFHGTTWPWKFDNYEGAVATFTLSPDAGLNPADSSAAYLQIQTVGNQFWGVQLMQQFKLDSGHVYDVYFSAWALQTKAIQTAFSRDYGDYGTWWYQDISLAAEPKSYGPYTYDCKVNDSKVYFKFIIGGNLIPMFLDMVKVIDRNAPTAIENVASQIIDNYQLNQNYPNPFNPSTKISFQLKKSANIQLAVYDLLGKEVTVLATGLYEAGNHEVTWNATDFTSGVYFYKLKTNDNFVQTRKLVLIK